VLERTQRYGAFVASITNPVLSKAEPIFISNVPYSMYSLATIPAPAAVLDVDVAISIADCVTPELTALIEMLATLLLGTV
jgi:hypothetical protein